MADRAGETLFARFLKSSCAGLTRASIVLQGMDRRVEPGDDEPRALGGRPRSRQISYSTVKQHDDTRPHSRGMNCPGFASVAAPGIQRAQGMPGAVAPARLVCSELRRNAHGQSTGTTEHTPAFPAQWFTTYGALSPECRAL